MGLKELNLKKNYDSDNDDLVNDFYVPVLSESIYYRRISGFFSSSSLSVAARGISQFIRNGGSMQLVCSAKLQSRDIDVIKKASKNPKEIIEQIMINDLEELEDKFEEDHVRALGWMVAKGKLEIKIAIVVDENGFPVSNGILHPKIGICEDTDGNIICFNGSNNETASGWKSNIEVFNVFNNWENGLIEYFEPNITKFEDYWQNRAPKAEIFDIPIAVEKKLIEIAPKNIEDLNLAKWNSEYNKSQKTIKLRGYQIEAIEKWVANGYKGIFEMATGTGKTFTALGCLKEILSKNANLVTIIASPYSHLVVQWEKSIKDFDIDLNIIVADSTSKNWKNRLANYLIDINNGIRENIIILTTHDTVYRKDFVKILGTSRNDILFIVDEVHAIGSGERKAALISQYNLRLGLSATPSRWSDEEGTDIIFKYFDKVVFSFYLQDAIHKINPDTGKTFLTPYEYKPKFISLTSSELSEYEKLTKKIARELHSKKNKNQDKFSFWSIKRQKIIYNALNKYNALEEILDDNKNLEYCLIYCSEKNQMEPVQKILNQRNIIQHKFTISEGNTKKDVLGGISEREMLLKRFGQGDFQALVSIKCLDEGVDVPPARIAILMASTSNPRQYIQRRGRVLRRFKGKQKAVIYDLIVIPNVTIMDPKIKEIEKEILQKEFKRYKEFAMIAKNKVECMNLIENYEKKYLW